MKKWGIFSSPREKLHELLSDEKEEPNAKDIQELIDKHPEILKEVGQDGLLPLHTAIIHLKVVEIILVLLRADSSAAEKMVKYKRLRDMLPQRDDYSIFSDITSEIGSIVSEANEDTLPLNLALKVGASDDVVLAVLEAYPDAAAFEYHDAGSDGSMLPLHLAIQKGRSLTIIKELLEKYPEGVETRTGKEEMLPLSLALTTDGLQTDVVLAILEAYPGATEETCSYGYNSEVLPLHHAIMETRSLQIVEELLKHNPDGAKARMTQDGLTGGILPLGLALVNQDACTDTVLAILDAYPDAASEPFTHNEIKMLPLHFAAKFGSSEEIVLAILNAFPEAAKKRFDDGRLSIEACAENKASDDLMLALLQADMPLQSDGTPIEHSGSWQACIAVDSDGAAVAVRRFLSKTEGGYGKHIHALTEKCDLSLASTKIRDLIHEHLLFCGRYKLKINTTELCSATCIAIRAQDVSEQADCEVVIKLMQNKNEWERELRAREELDLDRKYVVSALPNVPSETDFAEAVQERKGGLEVISEKFLAGIVPGKHAIVMDAADRNLLQIFYQEQPKIDAVRDILRQVFEAVNHLHGKNLMHGDISMLNIMRLPIDKRLRLADLSSSAKIDEGEDSFAGFKCSSAILPPEMIERIESDDQLAEFNQYWDGESDKCLVARMLPKLYKKQGVAIGRYAVKSFRTQEGKPLYEGLPYQLVDASEKIDAWSLGVLAFEMLTGEPLIPSTRDNDCVSGAAMHDLHAWGTQPEVLSDRFNKIQDDASRDLVMQLLNREPEERPSVASLLREHPFFHPKRDDEEMKGFIHEMYERLENANNSLHSQAKQLQEMSANVIDFLKANASTLRKHNSGRNLDEDNSAFWTTLIDRVEIEHALLKRSTQSISRELTQNARETANANIDKSTAAKQEAPVVVESSNCCTKVMQWFGVNS